MFVGLYSTYVWINLARICAVFSKSDIVHMTLLSLKDKFPFPDLSPSPVERDWSLYSDVFLSLLLPDRISPFQPHLYIYSEGCRSKIVLSYHDELVAWLHVRFDCTANFIKPYENNFRLVHVGKVRFAQNFIFTFPSDTSVNMMTSSSAAFPRYWPFVWGIHQSAVNSPHKGQ